MTIFFSVTFGVQRGYRPDGTVSEVTADSAVAVAYKWQDAMEREFERSGISVGGVVTPSITVYCNRHGCPRGGESTATVSGSSNKAFDGDADFYEALKRVVEDVKQSLKQTTARLDVWDTSQVYYRGESK